MEHAHTIHGFEVKVHASAASSIQAADHGSNKVKTGQEVFVTQLELHLCIARIKKGVGLVASNLQGRVGFRG